MKFLWKTNILMSTGNWAYRFPETSIEDFAKENDFYIVEIPDEYADTVTRDDIVDGKFILNKRDERIEKEEVKLELQEIENWFLSTDWIPNKIITGEWQTSEERWINYLFERSIKRARQDELNELLNA